MHLIMLHTFIIKLGNSLPLMIIAWNSALSSICFSRSCCLKRFLYYYCFLKVKFFFVLNVLLIITGLNIRCIHHYAVGLQKNVVFDSYHQKLSLFSATLYWHFAISPKQLHKLHCFTSVSLEQESLLKKGEINSGYCLIQFSVLLIMRALLFLSTQRQKNSPQVAACVVECLFCVCVNIFITSVDFPCSLVLATTRIIRIFSASEHC